jgi:hypothetical protein
MPSGRYCQKTETNAHLGDVLTTDSRNTLSMPPVVCRLGVEGLIVVETPDAVCVADKSRQPRRYERIVTQLQQTKREEHTLHRKVHALGTLTTASTMASVSRYERHPG